MDCQDQKPSILDCGLRNSKYKKRKNGGNEGWAAVSEVQNYPQITQITQIKLKLKAEGSSYARQV